MDGGYEISRDEQLSDVPMPTQQVGGGRPVENVAESGERPLRFHPPPGASDSDSQRFNPLLVEGFWAPDLTLMYAPKFTHKVSFRLYSTCFRIATFKRIIVAVEKNALFSSISIHIIVI